MSNAQFWFLCYILFKKRNFAKAFEPKKNRGPANDFIIKLVEGSMTPDPEAAQILEENLWDLV
jgi:hypothetical protein